MPRLQFEYGSAHTKIYPQRNIVKGHFKKKLNNKLKKKWEKLKEPPGLPKQKPTKTTSSITNHIVNAYGKFSKFRICFCGLDSGNLKFETVRTNRQHTCLQDLRRSV